MSPRFYVINQLYSHYLFKFFKISFDAVKSFFNGLHGDRIGKADVVVCAKVGAGNDSGPVIVKESLCNMCDVKDLFALVAHSEHPAAINKGIECAHGLDAGNVRHLRKTLVHVDPSSVKLALHLFHLVLRAVQSLCCGDLGDGIGV